MSSQFSLNKYPKHRMANFNEFKNSLAKEMKDNQRGVRIAFIYSTLRQNGLYCIGIGDSLNCNGGKDMSDAEVASALPDGVTKRNMIFRDKNNNDKKYVLGVYPKNKGTHLLIVFESPADKTTVQKIVTLDCNGDKDNKIDQMFRKLQSGNGGIDGEAAAANVVRAPGQLKK